MLTSAIPAYAPPLPFKSDNGLTFRSQSFGKAQAGPEIVKNG